MGTPQDDAGMFVDVDRHATSTMSGRPSLNGYTPPKVVLYDTGTGTGCGYGQAAMGPFYCPNDQTVYLDLSFWQQMSPQLGASDGDFAKAYVIAHEFGHHVQTLTGASQKVQQAQQSMGQQKATAIPSRSNCRPTAMPASGRPTPRRSRTAKSRWKQATLKPASRPPTPSATIRCRNAGRRPRSTRELHPRLLRPAHAVAEGRLQLRRPRTCDGTFDGLR